MAIKTGQTNNPTTGQWIKLLELIRDKELSSLHFQHLLASGLLADLLDCDDYARVDRNFFRKILKLNKIAYSPIARVRVINETAILVDLDAPPRLPFNGARVEFQVGNVGGWVRVEKFQGELCINDCKVVISVVEHKINGVIKKTYGLQEELSGTLISHPNIMDGLMDYPALIPANWGNNKEDKDICIHFPGIVFSDNDGKCCVRYCHLDADKWRRFYSWLDNSWKK